MSASQPPPPYRKDSKDSLPRVTITTSESQPLKSPRAARFAEATSIVSPVEPNQNSNPFADRHQIVVPTNHYMPQPQDVGFGYMGRPVSVEVEETDTKYLAPMTPRTPGMPLKSALKSPGQAPRNMDFILSPTFEKEEKDVEKYEKVVEKEQKKDLKSKMRVRMAKFIMRFVNLGCSLIVLSMVGTVLVIFHSTRKLAPRNGLPAWAPNTPEWPQILLLTIASISLVFCLVILYQYWKGGHRKAEKVQVYFTSFIVLFFVVSIVMWAVGAAALNQSRNDGQGKDMWGWSCKENKRRELFKDDVNYALACRLQNWSLICCIIEVVIEVIVIAIYSITFYRYYSKRRLRKTMAARDRARSDLYLAQLKMQSAPNTPGLPNGLLSPRDGGWAPPQGFEHYNKERDMENGDAGFDEKNGRFVTVDEKKIAKPKPFTLQAPPLKKARVDGGTPDMSPVVPATPTAIVNQHVPAAPGEQQYAQVSIPGAYQAPMSPGFGPSQR